MPLTSDDVWFACYDAASAALEAANKEAQKSNSSNRLPAIVVAATIGFIGYTLTRPRVKNKLSRAKEKIVNKISPIFVETPPIEVTNK